MRADNSQKNTDADRDPVSRSVSPFRAGALCKCPSCGEGNIFDGLLELRTQCMVCGFDLSEADPGDGPQIFVILILGALTAVLAFMIEAAFTPPAWFHVVFWTLFISGMGLWMLRVFKATLIALQFHHDAHEGNLDHMSDCE
ncbi:DUF983 domain-containing protein [Kordiimonas sp. SCSIO 12610]|uniref:DUF983 domain-containing protein n=1 Tax=Kordiimonas sp. SCSIO 12610 TaxID=2829597 RepID=UPI00210DE3C7|nr:DUF983 domain-containing protein [Kordiimonas sp. SCSIO 12610]UTW54908.1 DUF983 domain-containing protein [Kordiimonas sp. SCSIO 12610]